MIHRNTFFQVSLCNAMEQSVLDGDYQYKNLYQSPSMLGLGTFEDFDGEMVAVDGQYFQIKSDGVVRAVSGDQITPFVQVTNFHPEESVQLSRAISYEKLLEIIATHLMKKNFPYALRIEGVMTRLKIRSICKQHKPYPPVIEAIKQQIIFDHENIPGTMVGFWFPTYWEKISLPGFHLHFLSDDKKHGGHVLDVAFEKGTLSFAALKHFSITLPDTETFAKANLTVGHLSAEILQKEALE